MNNSMSTPERLTLEVVILRNESLLLEQRELSSKMRYLLSRLNRQQRSEGKALTDDPERSMNIVELLDYQNQEMRTMVREMVDITDKMISFVE